MRSLTLKHGARSMKLNMNSINPSVFKVSAAETNGDNGRAAIVGAGRMLAYEYARKGTLAMRAALGNKDNEIVSLGKAGRKRHMGVRPTVRGVVMNPCDHPHGGGEGKSPVGMASPVTPWGKPALGYKTRKKKKASTKFIIKRVN